MPAAVTATIGGMKFLFARPTWACSCVCLGLALVAAPARADDDSFAIGNPGYWRLVASPFTQHFRYSAEHKPVWAVGVERQRNDGWLGGASYFRNSFGQPSAYVYIGERYEGLFGERPLFLQWTGGILYGYKGAYKTKVPLNVNGFAPGAVVSAGWKFDRNAALTLHLLGDAAVMFQFSYDLR